VTAFQLVLFLHVIAMIAMFVALTVEWVCVLAMRRATTYEQARYASRLFRFLVPFGAPRTLVVLASGIYLATTLGLWSLRWVAFAPPALVAIAIAGAILAPRRNRMRSALETGAGPLPEEVSRALRETLLLGSLGTRTALLIGLVFVMTAKP
jgi:hypothetical protein